MSKDGLNRQGLGREQTAILIPVRLASSRFPGKPLKTLWGKPLFWWAYRAAVESGVASVVRVVTDSRDVNRACGGLEARCLYLPDDQYLTGSDRLAGALAQMPEYNRQVIINLQCDEAQITPEDLTLLVHKIWESEAVQVATLACPLWDDEIFSTNATKVLLDHRDRALYFTRAEVATTVSSGLLHIGVYAYRRHALESFGRYPRGDLEVAENLEQLRLLEEGVPIDVVRIEGHRQAVNSKADLEWLQQQESPATT